MDPVATTFWRTVRTVIAELGCEEPSMILAVDKSVDRLYVGSSMQMRAMSTIKVVNVPNGQYIGSNCVAC